MNSKIIFRALGFLLLVEGAAMFLTSLISVLYNEHDFAAFLISSGINIVIGLALVYFSRDARHDIGRREGYVIVTSVWVVFSIFGSLPYVISGAIPNFTNAFFETISGFSTTGSTIIADIESMPHGVLIWRSMTQ